MTSIILTVLGILLAAILLPRRMRVRMSTWRWAIAILEQKRSTILHRAWSQELRTLTPLNLARRALVAPPQSYSAP